MRREFAALVGSAALGAGVLLAEPASAEPTMPSVAEPTVSSSAVPTMSSVAVPCSTWTVSEVTSGQGVLENLAFDGKGTMMVSRSDLLGGGALDGVSPDGTVTPIIPEVDAPGGIAVDGDDVYFTTGNSFTAGIMGLDNGTVDTLSLDTGDTRTVAGGLVMPNGLARLSNGDILISRNLGSGAGITRIPAQAPHIPEVLRTDLGTVNGLAAHDGNVYTVTTFDARTALHILREDDLGGQVVSIELPGSGPLNGADDLTVGPDGIVYVAYNVGGKVVRVDPATGESCDIASGLPLVSSVRFGAGPGWNPDALYATSFTGAIYQIERP
ncbi:hypothetical protein BFN03_05540 [Rhodococcus sp. WMMA185]|uniref:hypothetical protein n=1 Tax=Rhodococcus sp. WMMA185 TaxID=679318 RepID=UPI00087842D8|nr:hypothetical protein [Rhodococcus sp. WMMA185]AOW92357.1 hypothetical protein BFN03_05540 [Rhodococcus sp. WMMA185]